MSFVNIKQGVHRGEVVTGVFPVVKPFNGKHVVVKTNAQAPFMVENARVKVAQGEFNYCTSNGEELDGDLINFAVMPGGAGEADATNFEAEFLASESEDDAMNRIQGTFDMLNEVTDAAAQGIIRGLVVSGPPGIGKSHGVEEVMRENNLPRTLRGQEPDYEVVKGAASAIGLYKTLYMFRKKGQTVIFDDCDSILFDELSLNLLKAALDSGDKRKLSWRTESRVLEGEDIPNQFDFEGSAIFLTNLDFDRTKASKIKMHLEAIQSRCHYLDLEISSRRDQLLRIMQVVRDGMLKDYNFAPEQQEVIVNYVIDNADYLRELSLRMVKKIADLVAMKPNGWEEIVEATCLKREAKFKRLVEAHKKAEGEEAAA
jgi:hypothetical protein